MRTPAPSSSFPALSILIFPLGGVSARTFPDLIWHSLADAAMKYGEFATWKWRGLTEGIKYFGRAAEIVGGRQRWARRIENGERIRAISREKEEIRTEINLHTLHRNKYLAIRQAIRAIVASERAPASALLPDATRPEVRRISSGLSDA